MRITPKFIFFFSENDIHSNFYPIEFEHEGHSFSSSEQAVMYRKAKLFGANTIADKILKAESPNEAKRIGRSKKIPFDEDVWVRNRERIYYEVLIDKFKEPQLNKFLLETKNRILVEASPYDKIWGAGLSEDNPLINYPEQWPGKNLLGKILMQVRDYYNSDQ